MNEETIDFRLNQIEKKLDQVTDLLLQTQAQELRLSTAEKGITDLNSALKAIEEKKQKNTSMWLSPLISTIFRKVL